MHVFNYQAIVTSDGFFSSFIGPYVSKKNDHEMMQSSDLKNYLQDLNSVRHSVDKCFFYRDLAYQNC